jgi:hypothetical protein
MFAYYCTHSLAWRSWLPQVPLILKFHSHPQVPPKSLSYTHILKLGSNPQVPLTSSSYTHILKLHSHPYVPLTSSSSTHVNAINVKFPHLENLKRSCQPPDLVLQGEDHRVVGKRDILREVATSHRPRRAFFSLDGQVQQHTALPSQTLKALMLQTGRSRVRYPIRWIFKFV